ncbi:MAG: hypothetical protein KAT65_04885 [Methanophagales archaeon]|nr:hypothetical protein [Methanophagales archaeon]
MDKTALVEKDVEEGKRLIEALDNAGFQVRAVLWFYLAESDEWRFVVASPLVERKGPKEAYAFVQAVLAQLLPPSGISLEEISVVSPEYDLIRLLKVAIQTGPGISGIRFTRNTINNTFIEDAYIYRMQ